jgi:hypothetical protein
MRRLIAAGLGLAVLAACPMPFEDKGLYACNVDTGEDCVTCDTTTRWCRDITAVAAGTSSLRTISGYSSTAIWAGGLNGVVVRWNGTRWAKQATGTIQQINGLWAASEDDVFAAASGWTWLHFDGSTWKATEEWTNWYWPRSPTTTTVSANHFSAVGGRATGSIGVVWTGDDQGLVNYLENDAGLNWPDLPWQPDNYWWALGVIQDGMVESAFDASTQVGVQGIWLDAGFNAFFVGWDGAIVKAPQTDTPANRTWDNVVAIENPAVGKPYLYAVWGDENTGKVFAVGDDGSFVQFDAATAAGAANWTTPTPGGSNVALFGICGVDENDIWVVGASGKVYNRLNSVWSNIPTPTTETLWGCYVNASDVFVITDEGAILHLAR